MRYEWLRNYAVSDKDYEILDALLKYDTQKKAGKSVKLSERQLRRYLKSMEERAASSGVHPDYDMTKPVAPGFHVKGVSTLYGDDGEIKAQWVKSQADQKRFDEGLQAAYDAISSDLPKEKATKTPKTKTDSNLATLFIITDYHLGMLSWGEETGHDWDLKIAEELLYSWFSEAIKKSPDAETAIIAQLGDLLHYDGLESVTPASKNVLDADSRFQKVVRVAIRAFRRIVKDALKKYKHVHLIHAEGNHDPASSIWLRELFYALYEDEPRATIERSPDPYYCYEHGKTSLFFHHGHKRKTSNIDDVFAAKFREVFGRTKYSYAHMGHLHHSIANESPLMIVEQHRTLASPDAYATRGGWLSGRGANVITYHKDYGEVGRLSITPEMLK